MRRGFALLLLFAALAACQQPATAAAPEKAVRTPPAARVAREAPGLKTAIFAGGCYWGVEAVFSHVRGVTSAVAGFHGGSKGDADYEKVSAGGTSHAEAVKITYDPAKVRYDQLLQIFFAVITDPTELNRQGPDIGTQYRSALIPVSEEQRLVASAYLAQLRAAGLWKKPIVTRIEPVRGFYPSLTDHQDFMAKNPSYPYIQYWDVAKVNALRRLFPALYKADFTRG